MLFQTAAYLAQLLENLSARSERLQRTHLSAVHAGIRDAEVVRLTEGLQLLILEHSLKRLEQNASSVVHQTGAGLCGEGGGGEGEKGGIENERKRERKEENGRERVEFFN